MATANDQKTDSEKKWICIHAKGCGRAQGCRHGWEHGREEGEGCAPARCYDHLSCNFNGVIAWCESKTGEVTA